MVFQSVVIFILLILSNFSFSDEIRWVPGDAHVHTEALNPNVSLKPEEILEEMKYRDVEVASVLIWGVRPFVTAKYFTGEDWKHPGPRILHYDLETSSFGSHIDHMIALGLKRWEFPFRSYSCGVYQWALDQGAVVGAAHADHWSSTYATYPNRYSEVPSDFPICLALGQKLYLMTMQTYAEGFRFLWYNLLNSGFQVPLIGGSDWPVAGQHPGDIKTYVAVEGDLTYEKWIQGIREGKTFISDARDDRLILKVDGQIPGATINKTKNAMVQVSLDYIATSDDEIEIIVNGQVSKKRNVKAGKGGVGIELAIKNSSWIAARTKKTHTGAIYVLVDGLPIRASIESPKYFISYLNWVLREIEGETKISPLNRMRQKGILEALKVFERIVEEAKLDRKSLY